MFLDLQDLLAFSHRFGTFYCYYRLEKSGTSHSCVGLCYTTVHYYIQAKMMIWLKKSLKMSYFDPLYFEKKKDKYVAHLLRKW